MMRPRSPYFLRPDSPWPGCWVDERLLCGQGWTGEVLSVGGGGERALALAIAGCRVTSLHADPVGAATIALTRAGASLAPEEQLQVLGILAGGRRVLLYHRLRPALDSASRAFWDAREAWIREGVYRSPKLEQFRAITAPLSAWRAIEDLLGEPDPARRAGMTLPSADPAFSLAGRLAFGAEFAARLDRALLRAGPDAFAVAWLATGTLRAPQRPAWSRAGHAALAAATVRALVHEPRSWMRDSVDHFDAVDMGFVPGDPAPWVAAARAVLRPGGVVAWWGRALAGVQTVPEPCPWMPDLRLLVG